MKRANLVWVVAVVVIFGSGAVLAGVPEELKIAAVETVENNGPLVREIGRTLWQYSETALKEHRSAEFLIDKLQAAGFRVASGVADMPTAFVGVYGNGHPVIGILAEYDALPGVGNDIVPERRSREDGITAGHGCGHNLFAAASVGAAISLKQLMESEGLAGTVKLFGTPAEETVVGKVYMVKAGVFDGLDAVIDWHPGTETQVRNQSGRAMNSFEIEFFGQAAHGAADPWNGRSALDAVELLNYGVNMMREHVKPTARIHYVIPDGGDAPNVVPEYARVWYYVRDVNRDQVEKLYGRVLKIAEGAALSTGTTHKVRLLTGVHEYLLNRSLQEAVQANMEWIGPVQFTAEEQQFARSLQKYLEVEEEGYDADLKPLNAGVDPTKGGSTDAAEVSYTVPTVAFRMTTAAAGIPWHSWAATACHGTSAGGHAALVAAKVIAATGVDLLTRPELVKAAKADFEKATQGNPYRSPVPEDQKPLLPAKETTD
jgi:aminobenzoyl-glutamate utilization protein B